MTDNEDKSTSKDSSTAQDPSRRKFLKNTGYATGGVVGGALLGGLIGNPFESEETVKEEKLKTPTEARMFFTRYEDFVVLEQATERIYPEDDNGAGAIELGVPYFIDKQLAGPWGMNGNDYRQPPLLNSDATTDQSTLTRGKLFINALRVMNKESQQRFDKTFDEAENNQQIEILKDFDENKINLKGVSSADFFELLRMSVLQGAFSDPLYGGNRNMEGWKMREFPGAVSSYADTVEEKDFVKMEPVSLTDYIEKS